MMLHTLIVAMTCNVGKSGNHPAVERYGVMACPSAGLQGKEIAEPEIPREASQTRATTQSDASFGRAVNSIRSLGHDLK